MGAQPDRPRASFHRPRRLSRFPEDRRAGSVVAGHRVLCAPASTTFMTGSTTRRCRSTWHLTPMSPFRWPTWRPQRGPSRRNGRFSSIPTPSTRPPSISSIARPIRGPRTTSWTGRRLADWEFRDYLFKYALPSYAKLFVSYQAMATALPGAVSIVSHRLLIDRPAETLASMLSHMTGKQRDWPMVEEAVRPRAPRASRGGGGRDWTALGSRKPPSPGPAGRQL